METLSAFLGDWTTVLARYGCGLVFLGAVFEGETIVTLGGVLAHMGVLGIYSAALCAATGAVLGDQIWFHLGRNYGPRVLVKIPRLSKHLNMARPMLSKNADWVAAGARFVYGTRIVGPMLLGMHGYSASRFLAINLLTGSVWALLFTFLGYVLGAGAKGLLADVRDLELLLLVGALLLLLKGLYHARRRRRNVKER